MSSSYTDREREILEARAKKLSTDDAPVVHREVIETVVVVQVGPERFGIPSGRIKEIIRAPRVVGLRLPMAWIVGIAQVRGAIVSVVDLAKWFQLGTLRSRRPFFALLTGPPGDLGVLFDEVVDVRDIYEDDLVTESVEKDASGSRPFLGTTKDLLVLIDMERLFSSADIIVDQDRTTPQSGSTSRQ